MARNFQGDARNYLTRATSPFPAAAPQPCTVAVWLMPLGGNRRYWCYMNNYTDNPALAVSVEYDAGQAAPNQCQMSLYTNAGYVKSGAFFSLAAQGWHHLAWVWEGAADAHPNRVTYYLDGTALDFATATLGGVTDAGAVLGTLTGGNQAFTVNGALAHLGLWSAALSACEVANLAGGVLPSDIAEEELVEWLPLSTDSSYATGQGGSDPVTWTVGGSPVAYPDPPATVPALAWLPALSSAPLLGSPFGPTLGGS